MDRSPTSNIFTFLDAGTPVRCHEHIAVIHRGGDTAFQSTKFLSEGLHRGHWCCCRAPGTRRVAMLKRLRELGVDVRRHQHNQSLQFPPDVSAPGSLLAWAKQFFAEAEAARAPAVRWLDEGVGTTRSEALSTLFFELHAKLNYLVKQYPSVVLCHYNLDDLELPHLFSAIATHRHLLVEGTLVRDNPFYVPAEKFLAMSPADRQRDLREVFRAVKFDLHSLLSTLAGYGQLQRSKS